MEEYDFIPDPLTQTAQDSFNINYLFPYQRLVISNILEAGEYAAGAGRGAHTGDEQDPPAKQIVILPTGAGKSLCFMLPSILLQGPTLVIFPLLSLISDQLRRCEEAGISAAQLIGGQSGAERRKIFSGIARGDIKIVLANPETALSPQVLPKLKGCRFLHLVFDEVHTVSEWGDTFRSAYLDSRRIYEEAEIPIVTAFTATASETVLSRVKEILFPDENPHIVSANPDRPNISYTVLPSLCKMHSLQLLLAADTAADTTLQPQAPAPSLPAPYPPAELVRRPALIFCSTRRTAERVALGLRMRLNENEIFFYHAGLERDEKKAVEQWFHGTKTGILAATIAFGMGVDVSGIRTVIHYNLSPSVEAYLQESGRAGRDREPAEAVVLLSASERAQAASERAQAASARAQALYSAMSRTDCCRRESLMLLLGAEPDTCFGCDVCRKTVEREAPMQREIISLVRHNPRRLSPSYAAAVLNRQYANITENDAKTMINELLELKLLKLIRRGPWRGKLTL